MRMILDGLEDTSNYDRDKGRKLNYKKIVKYALVAAAAVALGYLTWDMTNKIPPIERKSFPNRLERTLK